MKKETDLGGVKAIAKALLMTAVNQTPYSPILVQHPFTSSGLAALPIDRSDNFKPIDITLNEENLKRWQDSVSQIIDETENPYHIYMLLNPPYALTFLKLASPYLSRKDFSEILASAWINCEAPHNDPELNKADLLFMFKSADPKALMEDDEYKQLQELEDTLTVYRGVTSYNADNIKALSWTLNKETAKWFAHRFNEDGTVYEAQGIFAMINAIVQNKQGETAVIDLTVHYHEIYKELQSLGYYGSPERLLLRDEEDEEYSVKLYSDSDIGNSMILLLNERDSLYDAYLLDLAVTNAREEIKTDLEQNLLHGQYTTFSEVLDDINQMKIAAAETRLTFFCPLEATIYDDEGYYSPASNYTISDNRDKIEDMLAIEQLPDLGDMAEYVGEHSGIGNKLIYAVWGLEEIRGEVYGKIDCYLTEALNAEETEKLREAVCGQASDGFGESFEQRAIKTEDGELYVSFWNSSDDYFLYTESEMDEYIQNQHGQQMGVM